MSTVKVAINGFGRIGRLVYRQIFDMEGIEVVAVNDLTSPKVLAHLLKYDSAQGGFGKNVTFSENSITVEGHEIKIYAQKASFNFTLAFSIGTFNLLFYQLLSVNFKIILCQ